MPKLPKGQAVQNFNLLTEALRRGRRRIRPQYVPELVAWLVMKANLKDEFLHAARRAHQNPHDEYVAGITTYTRHCLSMLQQLINELCDGWDKHDWDSATNQVADELGIVIGLPLPESTDPMGKVRVPTI